MSRRVYAGILDLHPRMFRERYAGEMLLIFEEAAPVCGTARLFADAIASLVRQWLHDPMAVTVAGGVIGGLIPFLMAIAMMADWPHIHHHH